VCVCWITERNSGWYQRKQFFKAILLKAANLWHTAWTKRIIADDTFLDLKASAAVRGRSHCWEIQRIANMSNQTMTIYSLILKVQSGSAKRAKIALADENPPAPYGTTAHSNIRCKLSLRWPRKRSNVQFSGQTSTALFVSVSGAGTIDVTCDVT